jgi:hypothetical protein
LRKGRRRLTIAVVLGILALGTNYVARGIPSVAAVALNNAESFELLSLDPGRIKGEYHRTHVLGRAPIDDPAERKRLYNALQSGARWNLALPALCFDPRHAIIATTAGRVTELLICFECSQVQVWQDGNLIKTFIIGDRPESVFDDALRRAGLPLAPKRS